MAIPSSSEGTVESAPEYLVQGPNNDEEKNVDKKGLIIKGRGRPGNTGEYAMLQQYRGLKQKVATLQSIKGINDPELEAKTTRTTTQLQKDLAPEFEAISHAPMSDVLARVLTEASKVMKLADSSGNLKGTYKRGFKEAALIIKSAATAISFRTQQNELGEYERELEDLRLQLKVQQDIRTRLEETIKSMHERQFSMITESRKDTSPILSVGTTQYTKNRRPKRESRKRVRERSPPSSEEEIHTIREASVVSPRDRPNISFSPSLHVGPSSQELSRGVVSVGSPGRTPLPPSPPQESRNVSSTKRKPDVAPLFSGPVTDQTIKRFNANTNNKYGWTKDALEIKNVNSIHFEQDSTRDVNINLKSNLNNNRYNINRRLNDARKLNIEAESLVIDRACARKIELLLEQRDRDQKNLRENWASQAIRDEDLTRDRRNEFSLLHPPVVTASQTAGGSGKMKNKSKRRKKMGPKPVEEMRSITPVWSVPPPVFHFGGNNNCNVPAQDPTITWSQVVRKTKRKTVKPTSLPAPAVIPTNSTNQGIPKDGRQRRRIPRSAAITITCNPGEYEETMRLARTRIALDSLGIKDLKIRRAATGALVLEVSGAENNRKANCLAEELRALFKDKPTVRIARPIKTAEIRIRDLEGSVTSPEIALAIAAEGDCRSEDVRVGNKGVAPNGLGTVWAKCPLAAANILAQKRSIRIGWSRVRVEVLPMRPLQCFRCLEGGHVRANCPSENDRSSQCYRCGEGGHRARECVAPPRCPLCTDLGLPSSHRTGSMACTPSRTKNAGGRARPLQTSRRIRSVDSISSDTRVLPAPSSTRRGAVLGEETRKVGKDIISSDVNNAALPAISILTDVTAPPTPLPNRGGAVTEVMPDPSQDSQVEVGTSLKLDPLPPRIHAKPQVI